MNKNPEISLECNVFLQKSIFLNKLVYRQLFPSNEKEEPMIMIGAGTGIAPFIGFIEERLALVEEGK